MVFWWWCFWYGAIGAADGDGTVWFVRRRYGVAQWTEPSGRPDWMQHFRIRPWGPCRLSSDLKTGHGQGLIAFTYHKNGHFRPFTGPIWSPNHRRSDKINEKVRKKSSSILKMVKSDLYLSLAL